MENGTRQIERTYVCSEYINSNILKKVVLTKQIWSWW